MALLAYISTLVYIAIISVIIRWLIDYYNRISRLPPGPWGLPIVGYLPWLTTHYYRDLGHIGKKYGGMFTISLGSQTFVCMSDWKSIKATFFDHPKFFEGRTPTKMISTYSHDRTISFCYDEKWRKQRILALQAMKCVGMNKKSVADHLTHLIDSIINSINQDVGHEFIFEKIIEPAFSKYNWQLLSSYTIGDDEKEFKEFIHMIHVTVDFMRATNPINVLPWLRFVPPTGFGFWKFQKGCNKVWQLLSKLIDKYDKNTHFPDENVIAYHLHEFKSKPKIPPYEKDYLMGTLLDLYVASYDTTLSTSLTCIFQLCKRPEIQERIHKEMDAVVGRERLPWLSDLPELIQLEALILETHRVASIVPLALPHTVTETIEINGYTLPKGQVCFPNIYAVHHDPDLWDEPDKFKPERFIKDNKIVKPPYLIPFSIGSRSCPGEPFAELELRMVFASLLHTYSFSFPKNRPSPPLKQVIGITIKPAPFLVVATPRE